MQAQGEAALAAAVLVTVIDDAEIYEQAASSQWYGLGWKAKNRIERAARAAVRFLSSRSARIWFELADVDMDQFRRYIMRQYPQAYNLYRGSL